MTEFMDENMGYDVAPEAKKGFCDEITAETNSISMALETVVELLENAEEYGVAYLVGLVAKQAEDLAFAIDDFPGVVREANEAE